MDTTGVFAIMLNVADSDTEVLIKQQYPVNYKISDTCFLVADDGQSRIGEHSPMSVHTISKSICMSGDNAKDGVLGFIAKLDSSYGGRNYNTLWDWIKKIESVLV